METSSSNIYRGGSTKSSNKWRNTSVGAFSKSSYDENDEEALLWATLEKLPTYTRMRRGILTSHDEEEEGGGDHPREIDISKLGLIERRNLLDRLVKVAEEDNHKFLSKLKNRIDRVGLDMPTVEVRFEHLNIEAEAYVGNRALPTLFNFCANYLEGLLNDLHILPSRKKPFPILQDVSGIIKPRRLTLLLGPPSSGKTTLLLALAGKLSKDLKFSGRVTYNGHGMEEFVPQRTSAYVSQYDLHVGEMTVRETLAFSARCQGVGTRYEMLAELLRREKAANIIPDTDLDIYMKAAALEKQETNVVTDYILKILGLDVCADTMVGDAMIRGISGGQKRRVTTGEILVGPASALFMDEISTGLDSSTTFQVVNSIRQSIHILSGTAVISLLQPPPEVYSLFDDIILLSDGQIVYQGPRDNVLEFFDYMGFRCPERTAVADFLQEVMSRKDQEQYWMSKEEPYSYVSAKKFAQAFQSFHIGQKLSDELRTPFDKSKGHPAALATKKYGAGQMEILKACISKEFLLMKRNSFVYLFTFSKVTLAAFITMTVFLRTEMHHKTVTDGLVYTGAVFFAVIMCTFNGFSQVSMTVLKLPAFYKQRDYFFYPSWAYALPKWILNIPISFAEVAVWVFVTYYVIGFDPNATRFFRQYFVLVCNNQMASGLFRLMGALGRNLIVANTIGGLALLVLIVFSGFSLLRDDVKKWWKWGYWSCPTMYTVNGVSVNEFLGESWRHVPANLTESLGIMILKYRKLFTQAHWYWIAVGALIGFTILFNFLFTLALQYLDPLGKPQAMLSEEAWAEKNANTTEEFVQLSTRGESSSENRNVSSMAQSRRVSNDHRAKKQGMVLPFQPHSMIFNEIRYAVDMPQEMKAQGIAEDHLELLKGVSGTFRPGVMTALMGVSGAGKTTLMDVLAGRKTGGYITGSILISGYPKKQETFARVSGYCEQVDIHSPNITVYESLLFSAWLRLPAEVDYGTKKLFIEEVMELVELKSLRESLVGLPTVNGLSIEQRKRLTIAVELVANPSIIFMDEPTSGLDARAAAIVMRTVRNTVNTGRTVVCTIHQPSISIFDAFDELLLMKRGGREIYVGPLGRHCCHLIQYFEAIEGVPKIKEGYNPATWMLEVSSTAQEEILGVDFADKYKNSDLYRRNKALIEELSMPPPGSNDLHFQTQYAQPYLIQCTACLWKQHLSYQRNAPYIAVRLVYSTFIAVVFGTIFWDLGSRSKDEHDVFNALGSVYCAVSFLGFQNAASVQPVVAIERTVFYREKSAGLFASLPYALGQLLIELPYTLAQTAMYSVVVYSMIGFHWTVKKFFWYMLFMFFTFLYFTYYGMMTTAVSPNENIAAIILTMLFEIWLLFSGFIIPPPRIPEWWKWFYWTCPIAWTMYGLAASQYGDINATIANGETFQSFIRDYFGFRHDFVGIAAAVLSGMCVVFGAVFVLSIKIFNFQKR